MRKPKSIKDGEGRDSGRLPLNPIRVPAQESGTDRNVIIKAIAKLQSL